MKRELNISNYEEWMVDHMDGLLGTEEYTRLQNFLGEHPELSVDLDRMKETVLIPDEYIAFSHKASLKKQELQDEAIITLMEAGGNTEHLSDSDKKLVGLYTMTKLEADLKVTFPDKSILRRTEGKVIPLWFKAASLAASLFLAIFLLPSNDTPIYESRNHGPVAWEAFEFEMDSPRAIIPAQLNEEKLEKASKFTYKEEKKIQQMNPKSPLLVQNPDSDSSLPKNIQSDDLELPDEIVVDLSVPDQEIPLHELTEEENQNPVVENPVDTQPNHSPVSKSLQEERPYTTALELLKKATASSEILAIQDVDPEASYVQASLKLGRFEVDVKRKKKN